MTEYWYARRFPVGHWRNAMAPISPKARRVIWVFAGGITAGMLAFFISGFAGYWQIGALIFAVLAAYSSWYYFVVPIRRFDRHHTVEDYRAGRVGPAAATDTTLESAPLEKFAMTGKFARFSEHWRPKVVAEFTGQELKLVKVKGEFPWHHHETYDELFIVWKGVLRVEFRDRVVRLAAGEALVVPRGVEHRTVAKKEAEVIFIAPKGERNSGNVEDHVFTAPDGVKLRPDAPHSLDNSDGADATHAADQGFRSQQ
jgi:mannose-6-phosphate isomerase-like protein (cupin superfamily)